jgi:uncharacterized RmlC-like cupin family protein
MEQGGFLVRAVPGDLFYIPPPGKLDAASNKCLAVAIA